MRRWFLSYNSQDLSLVQGLERSLKRKDPQASIFFAPKSLRAGGYWAPALADEIAEATGFVLLVGEKGLGPWQVMEYYEALDKRVKSADFAIVLVLLEGQPAPGLPFLRQLHWVISPDPASEQTAAQLAEAAAGSGSRPGELWRYASPYRGLAAMSEADSDFFFGRERETCDVLAALGGAAERLPVLLGNSGVGKSSLAQAGVLAAMKRQAWPEGAAAVGGWPPAFHDSRRWCFLSLKPGVEPLKALVEPFFDTWQFAATDPERVRQQNGWIALLHDGKATLADLLDATERRYQELGQPKPPAFFAYVDQGEELYVRSEEGQRRRFSRVLAEGLRDPRLHALMSLRADFLGALQNDEPLYAVHHKIDVPPLREAELCQVVSRPAALLSARFEAEGLAADIARRTAEESTRDAGALPLLSYLLDDMWTQMIKRGDGVLRLPAHAMELGGVLAERANAFLARYPNAEETLRRIFTLKLATVREDGAPTRRAAQRSEFSAEEWRLVSELADYPHRLLVTATSEAGESYAEVAHEAIFQRWDKLRQWMATEREFLIWKSALEADRRRWERSPEGSRNDALLMGVALAQAHGWLAKRAEDLSRIDRDFIELSMRRDALERQRRESLRRRLFATTVGALGIVSVLGLFSFVQWREAVRQQLEAQQQRDRAERAVATFITRLFSSSVAGTEDLDQAIELDPTDATSYFLRAVFEFGKDPDRALADLSQVIQLDPRFTAAYLSRAGIYENQQEYARALADYDQVLKFDPGSAMAFNGRGFDYYKTNDYDRALADYNQALRLKPNYAIALNNRGNLYFDRNDYDRAIADYNEAIRVDPKYAFAYNNRGNTYYSRRDYDHAIPDLDQAIQLDPNYAVAYNNRGNVYFDRRDYDRAIADYSQAIRSDPKYAIAYSNRGNTYYNKNDYDHAIPDLDQAIQLDPKYAVAYNNRGNVYFTKHDYDRAIADYSEAIRVDPKFAIAYSNRGNGYFNQRDFDRGIADYTEAVRLDPNNASMWNGRCLGRAVIGQLQEALADCNEALRLRRDDANALGNRGLAYLKLGQFALAIADYDAALRINGNLADSLYGRGFAKQKTGDQDGANADIAAAKAIRPDIAEALALYGVK